MSDEIEYQPPKWPLRILRKVLKSEFLEEIEGDMEEVFYDNIESFDIKKARKLYTWEVIKLLRPALIKNLNGNYQMNQFGMFNNYLKVAWRNLFKQVGFSSINILSLTIGMAACLMIFLFTKNELSFDGFHTKKDEIYRLCELQTWPGIKPQNVPITWPKMGFRIQDFFPEVENYTRFHPRNGDLWEANDKKIIVDKAGAVDSTFLQVFDYQLLSGDPTTALIKPNSVLITEQLAKKLFGSTDVIGKTMEEKERVFNIVGVLKDIPNNSHLQFDLLFSLSTYRADNPDFNNRTGSNFMLTYLLLHDDADVSAMEARFPDYLKSLVDDEDVNDFYGLFIQPLEDVHLASFDIEHDYENHNKFNGKYIDVFVLTGIFILIIACVNFMNLTTARSTTRFKEVGVRKTIGASRRQLIFQFSLESVLMSLLALGLALMLVFFTLPYLNLLIDRELSLITIFRSTSYVLIILGGTLFLGVLTGLYPALRLSAIHISSVLKGGANGGKKSIFRSSMIVLQFSLALAMIVSTLVVVQQLFFINHKDIGFDTEQMLLVKMNQEVNDKYQLIKNELSAKSSILGVTASGQRLGNNLHQWGMKYRKDTAMINLSPSNVLVDYNFLDVYGIKLIEGRTFSKDRTQDDGLSFIVNETFANELGVADPIGVVMGHSWYPDDSLGLVIGVTEDFNFNSLHHKVNALSMVVHNGWGFSEMTVKLKSSEVQTALNDLETVWNEHVVDYPLDYQFLDTHFEEVYRSDQQMASVVTMMAALSILIGCMGLFGLAAISIERRLKEIGVRKVLGASTSQLLVLLSRNFATLILISFLLATPMTYFYLSDWLESFAFRIDINPLIFLLGGILVFGVAMATISFHTLRASRANPVDILRDE